MMQHKRSLASVNQSSFVNLMPKRLKIDAPLSSKEKKERVSERVSALQQLVSPYGKTDTASVLLDSMEYISFLHEQVKVLSAPYLCSTEVCTFSLGLLELLILFALCDCFGAFLLMQGEEVGGLRAKGLCVVPTCFVLEVGSSNGADIWAPIKTSPPSARRLVSDEGASVVTYS
ncbi:transcription factor bHLH153-like isoform X3 [Salvia splendens]|nr:transcription factor bHLH153-like isoform X3 [Salvia splendens]XP_042029188.1 transcription factor bHLH153-like isoform X3 [Salvia splendens]XP_042029189.1 transcription factor bHLH153-like isoform X3 [Salvia splendens]XP_042029190.1 transcription factor bHLH153-like isoform X3 [Salvia splendens]